MQVPLCLGTLSCHIGMVMMMVKINYTEFAMDSQYGSRGWHLKIYTCTYVYNKTETQTQAKVEMMSCACAD